MSWFLDLQGGPECTTKHVKVVKTVSIVSYNHSTCSRQSEDSYLLNLNPAGAWINKCYFFKRNSGLLWLEEDNQSSVEETYDELIKLHHNAAACLTFILISVLIRSLSLIFFLFLHFQLFSNSTQKRENLWERAPSPPEKIPPRWPHDTQHN